MFGLTTERAPTQHGFANIFRWTFRTSCAETHHVNDPRICNRPSVDPTSKPSDSVLIVSTIGQLEGYPLTRWVSQALNSSSILEILLHDRRLLRLDAER